MLSALPAFILAPLAFSLFCLNLALCGSIVTLGGVIKFLLPTQSLREKVLAPMHQVYRLWSLNNFLIINLVNDVDWQISGDLNLNKNGWYLLIANHQSWLDIFVLTHFARQTIPEPKFFLKDSLKKVPFVGMACWALGMPFMKRYSKKFLEQHPELKGKDIETTKRSCAEFQHTPTTIINFVEGTRFTEQKHQQQSSPFHYLLPPKAGGIAFTLAAMGEQFDKILNITLLYPDQSDFIMKDVLCGRLTTVVLTVEQVKINDTVVGDYFNDNTFKTSFQQWLNDLWQQKDQQISTILIAHDKRKSQQKSLKIEKAEETR